MLLLDAVNVFNHPEARWNGTGIGSAQFQVRNAKIRFRELKCDFLLDLLHECDFYLYVIYKNLICLDQAVFFSNF